MPVEDHQGSAGKQHESFTEAVVSRVNDDEHFGYAIDFLKMLRMKMERLHRLKNNLGQEM